MNKYGPTKADLQFRLIFSIAGLALIVGAILSRGVPTGPANIHAIGVSTVCFGGAAIWTIRKLMKGEHSDGL